MVGRDRQLKAEGPLETVYQTWTLCDGSRKVISPKTDCVR